MVENSESTPNLHLAMTQKRPVVNLFLSARWVAASPENAPVNPATPANGIGLLLPPTKPDAYAMDNSHRDKNCPSNQEGPELFIKASVEVLAPARETQQSSKESH